MNNIEEGNDQPLHNSFVVGSQAEPQAYPQSTNEPQISLVQGSRALDSDESIEDIKKEELDEENFLDWKSRTEVYAEWTALLRGFIEKVVDDHLSHPSQNQPEPHTL